MTDQSDRDAVWSRQAGETTDFVVVPPPARDVPGSTPIVRAAHPAHPRAESGLVTAAHEVSAPPPPDAQRHWWQRRDPVALGGGTPGGTTDKPRGLRLGWFLGAAGTVLGVGLIVVLAMAITGSFGGGGGLPFGVHTQKQTGPPLAQACPPPTATANPGYKEGPPAPPGPRTSDRTAGISYKQFSSPFQPWHEDWVGGQLKVHYRVGQAFVTEQYSKGQYLASVLSGSVPATVNDGTILDLKCVGQQIVADVRESYYPQPNHMDKIEDKLTTIGGLNAWVSIFRLHFDDSKDGLKADNELVGVVTLDVGKPTAAVLYVSIPGTHKQYDWVVKDAINSIRRS
ncbi:hypothetical protein [Actinocatenispora rupis]|nr:hypothetical protein [Actinocatenispora rupis]